MKQSNQLSSVINMAEFLKNKRPTITPIKHFKLVDDAIALKNAIKYFSVDEKVFINILAYRSNHQRQQIMQLYKITLGRDLVDDIKTMCKGNLANLFTAMLIPVEDFLARQIHDAIDGLGTDADSLIECLCGLTNDEMLAIKLKYFSIYDCELEKDIADDTTGLFRRLLVSLVNGGRDESQKVDRDVAMKDVVQLLNAGELIVGHDFNVFNEILCTRNYLQIRQINIEYKNLIGHSLINAIEEEFSGDVKKGLQAIIQWATDSNTFFANRLYKSMVGLGTDDAALIRLIVWRSEIDLENIKETFESLYGKSLKSWIKGDTSGNYRKCLYALINETDD